MIIAYAKQKLQLSIPTWKEKKVNNFIVQVKCDGNVVDKEEFLWHQPSPAPANMEHDRVKPENFMEMRMIPPTFLLLSQQLSGAFVARTTFLIA